jgi:arginase
MNYAALLHAMTSEYVGKEYIGQTVSSRYSGLQIICAPYAGDAATASMKLAPETLISTGLAQFLSSKSAPVFLQEMESSITVESIVCNACLSSFDSGSIPYVIGGDHTVAAGLAEAAVKCNPGVGWIVFSAHGDLHKKLLPGKCAAGTALFNVVASGISPDNLVIIGLRTLDTAERELLQASRVHVFTMEHIDRLGIAEVMRRALTVLRNTQQVFVDLAVNCLDLENDSENMSPGLNLREAHCAMEILADSGKVGGLVLSEFDPLRDASDIIARKVCALLASLAGKKIL